jgi:hypothetical protein
MKKISVLLICVLLVGLAGCKRYTGPQRDYSSKDVNAGFNPPAGWAQEEPPSKEVNVIFKAPEQVEGLYANVNLVVGNMPSEMSAKEALEKSISEIRNVAQEFTIVSQGEMQTEQGAAALLVYTVTMQGVTVKGQQVYLTVGKKLAVLTCTAKPSNFDKYKNTFDDSCKSLWVGK